MVTIPQTEVRNKHSKLTVYMFYSMAMGGGNKSKLEGHSLTTQSLEIEVIVSHLGRLLLEQGHQNHVLWRAKCTGSPFQTVAADLIPLWLNEC